MQQELPATARFLIGGEMPVCRLGFGTMRLTGPGSFGWPEDREEAQRLLRELPALGIDLIDTADAYGPDIADHQLRAALHPYPKGMVIATKGGVTRPSRDRWVPLGRPEYLFQQVRKSLEILGLDVIDLWQLHRIDPKVPRDEQFDAIRQMQDEGLIRHAGLSEVGVADIEEAGRHFPVATVQNRYNLADRGHEAVLAHCESRGIGFIPWAPLASGGLASADGAVRRIAAAHGVSPSAVALAWLLRRSPVMLPIPGTSKLKHARENIAALRLELSEEDHAALDTAGPG